MRAQPSGPEIAQRKTKITHARARTQTALTQSERARAINLESPIESTTQKTTAYLVVRFGAELAEDGVLISEGLRRRHGAHPEQQSTSPIEP